ncbi:MAG TPA: tetratricopeptide repeat protein [Chitinophagales bacterium]|nr:tetratricopeptide repeat protein [Chitinophagales bacterium]
MKTVPVEIVRAQLPSPSDIFSAILQTTSPQIYGFKYDRPFSYVEVPIDSNANFSVRAGTSCSIFRHYLKQIIVPYPLAFYYGYKVIQSSEITEPLNILTLLVYLALTVFALLMVFKRPLVSFAVFIYLLGTVIYSNILILTPGMVADRFMLIPSIGFCLLLAYLLMAAFKQLNGSKPANIKSWPVGLKLSTIGVLLVYSGLSLSRNTCWKDDLTLFQHDIKFVNNSAQAHNILGHHLVARAENTNDPLEKKQLLQQAANNLETCIRIYPPFFNATYDLGRIFARMNENDSAAYYYQLAITLDTTYLPVWAEAADILFQQKRYAEAIPYYQHMINYMPGNYNSYGQLSFIYFTLGDFQKSMAINQLAIKKLPANYLPYANIGRTYAAMGIKDSALMYLRRADSMNGNDPLVKNSITELENK